MVQISKEDSQHMADFRAVMREARAKQPQMQRIQGRKAGSTWHAAGKGRVRCSLCNVEVHANATAKRTHEQGREHARNMDKP